LTVRLTAAEFATAHEAPESVTVTMLPDVEPAAVQLVKPELRTIVGVAGTVKPALNFKEIVSPAAIAPLALVVNVSVQLAVEPPVCTEPLNVGLETEVAALIVTADAGVAAIMSLLVAMPNVLAARLPAAGFVRPLTVRVAVVDAATEHDAPASVTVTVVPDVEPVAVQVVKPEPSVIVGVAGMVKPELKTIVIVAPVLSAPAELVLNDSVQSERAPPVCGEPAKLMFVGAFEMTIADGGLTATVSRLVLTLKPDAAYEPLVGFVRPFSVSDAAVLAATEHEAPASVTVAVVPTPVAVAVQLVKPLPSVTVGAAGTVKPAGKTIVIVSPALIAPVELVVKPSVQFALADGACVEPLKLTELTEVAAEMTTLDAGFAGTGSPLVETAKVFAASVPAPGFVSPVIVSDAAVEAGSEHDAPTRVIVTVCALAVAVVVQLVKPEFSTIVGVAGTVNPELSATVIVLPAESAPLALDVNPTVQSERAEPVCGDPLKVMFVGAFALYATSAMAYGLLLFVFCVVPVVE